MGLFLYPNQMIYIICYFNRLFCPFQYLSGILMSITFTDKNIDIAQLYPFSLTRKIEDFRVGIFTIREKWEQALDFIHHNTHYTICANLLPSHSLIASIRTLKPGQCICDADNNVLIQSEFCHSDAEKIIVTDCTKIEFPWQIFQRNAQAIAWDFEEIKKSRSKQTTGTSLLVSNPENVFIENGATIEHAIINAVDGPVFVENGALVMEGSLLRGPVYIGKNAVVKMGAKIYGATTIGPGCTVGGEIKNAVLFANSNKAHDGYLGDSVIGEWCNWGAGTSNSNLKNTGGEITVHLQNKKYTVGNKCGVLMGDYSRTAINTSINTGTVIGVCANVFGHGLTPQQIPSFSWGFDDAITYQLEKAFKNLIEWKGFKQATLTATEITALTKIYNSKK